MMSKIVDVFIVIWAIGWFILVLDTAITKNPIDNNLFKLWVLFGIGMIMNNQNLIRKEVE